MLTEAELMPFYEAAQRYADPGNPGAVNHKPRPLYPLELELIRCMVRGEAARPRTLDGRIFDDTRFDPENEQDDKSDRRTVRARLIRWVCTDRAFAPLIDPKGLDLRGAVVVGEIDLEGVDFGKPIALAICRIEEPLSMRGLQATELSFVGSSVRSFNLDNARLTGGLYLCAVRPFRFEAVGEVRFVGATIGGRVNCQGALLKNPGGTCLEFDGANITGDVVLCASPTHRFEAEGEVRFLGATIGGQVNCKGASLKNPAGDCLGFDRANITGSVLLSASTTHRLEAEGQVRFLGATIGGQVNCQGASFKKPSGTCLFFDGANITGSVFLSAAPTHRFEAEGEVRFLGATIGGQVNCQGASLKNPAGDCLGFDTAHIRGGMLFCDSDAHRFDAEGTIRFLIATIAGALLVRKATLVGHAQCCLRSHGATIHDYARFEDVRVIGVTQTLGPKPSSDETIEQSPPHAPSLDLESTHFLSRLTLHNVTFENASLSLKHAHIEYLDDVNADGTLGIQGLKPGALRLDGLVYRKVAELKSKPLAPKRARLTLPISRVRNWLGHSAEGAARSAWLRLQRPPHENDSAPKKYLRWFNKPQTNFRPQPYEQLSKVLFIAGREDSAKSIQLSKFSDRAATRGLLARLWCLFLRLTIGHGYRVHYVLLPLLVLFGFGGWYFAKSEPQMRIADGDVLVTVTQSLRDQAGALTQDNDRSAMITAVAGSPQCGLTKEKMPGYVAFNPWFYSLDALTPIIDLGQVSAWRPVSGKPLYYFWAHRLGGAVFFGLLLTGIGQTIVRRNPAADTN